MAIVFPVRKWAILALLGMALAFLLWPGWPLRTEIKAIRLYQSYVSPLSSHFVTCRFEKTCSHYALQVLEEEGLIRGNWLVLRRLVHCSPAGAVYDWIRGETGVPGDGVGRISASAQQQSNTLPSPG